MMRPSSLVCSAIVLTCIAVQYTQAEECEVCENVLNKFSEYLGDGDRSDKDVLETKLRKFCKTVKGKDERFCNFIGAREDSATSTVGDVTKPMSYHKPVEKICQGLAKKDSQICELKYEKQIDLVNANFKKMKVKELKKILSVWGEDCKGCTEKSDFITKIETLLPKYAPDAHAARLAKQEL